MFLNIERRFLSFGAFIVLDYLVTSTFIFKKWFVYIPLSGLFSLHMPKKSKKSLGSRFPYAFIFFGFDTDVVVQIYVLPFWRKIYFSGTRFQDFWNQNPSKNVATEHEDKADCPGNFDSTDPCNSPICVSWVQLWEIGTILRCLYHVISSLRLYEERS